MEQGLSTVERAFQLAEHCVTVDEIRTKLKKEGYSNVDAHLTGGAIRSDLARTIKKQNS